MSKLLLIGTDAIHTLNYLNLVRDYFAEVFVVTDTGGEKYNTPFKHINFSFSNPFAIINSIYRIKKIIKDFQPDIIHIQQAGTHAWMTLKAARNTTIPVIVTAWGSDILHTPKQGKLYYRLTKSILKQARYFTSDSQFMADEMNRIANKKLDITIANFGINIDPSDVPKEDIIYSNRAHKPLYRIDLILLAFSRFIKTQNRQTWKLVVAGDGEQTPALHNLADKLGISDKVEFAGWVNKEQNSVLYFKSRVFVSIPESDATSISLLEAMAAGCIPVVSNLPANAEWIKNNINGIIVSDFDSDFLSSIFALDEHEVRQINEDIIEQHGTQTANRNKFTDLYNRILLK